MSRYLPEGKTGFFDIPVEKVFHGKSNGEIFKMICEDEVLRSSILSGIAYFANDFLGRYQYFKDWNFKEFLKFERLEYEQVMKWAIPAIRELKVIQLREEFLKNRGTQSEVNIDDFVNMIPEKYKNCTLDSLQGISREVAESIIDGKSVAICSDGETDKMAIAWVVARNITERGVRNVRLVKHIELNAEFSENARAYGGTVKYINDNYTSRIDVLMVSDVESLASSDIQTRNFKYLLRQRYENKLQTVLLLNLTSDEAMDEKTLEKYLGDVYPMFTDEDWPAKMIVLSGGKKVESEHECIKQS